MLILDFYLQIMNHRQNISTTNLMVLFIRFGDLRIRFDGFICQSSFNSLTKIIRINQGGFVTGGKYPSIDFRCRRNSIEKNEVEVGTINFKFVGFTTNKSFLST